MARRYIAGTSREDALARAASLAEEGVSSSIDLFGERVTDPDVAERVCDAYVALAQALSSAPDGTFLSIDLSHIALDEGADAARRRLERIISAMPSGARVQVGAEEESRADRTLEVLLGVARAGGGVSGTIQANLRRSRADAEALAEAGVPARLVKGAYVEDPRVARRWGEETDLAYIELAALLHTQAAEVALATHDPALREALLLALPRVSVEMLLGVRDADARALATRGVPVRVYMPYGADWFRYAMRRWAESMGA
ncbi:MAG TPA: proline dehydrogenase family protein [Solirubrobacteraceae bacterium]|nr:proline dehydrogenase family protein [Solirubrobacteraceae bacterium]